MRSEAPVLARNSSRRAASRSWQRHAARAARSAWSGWLERSVPERDHRVPLVLVEGSPFVEDDLGHVGQVVVEERGERHRVELLRDGGETLQIGEQNRELAPLPPQAELRGILEDLLDHVGAQIELECLLDELLLTPLGGVVQHQGPDERESDGQLPFDDGPPEAEAVSDQTSERGNGQHDDQDRRGKPRPPAPHNEQAREERDDQRREDDCAVGGAANEPFGEEIVEHRGVDLHARGSPG